MSAVLQLDGLGAADAQDRALMTVVHTGKRAVLACSAKLEELAGRSGQDGAMHGLAFLLDQEYTARKLPHLICFHAQDGLLVGAVLLFEYRWSRWATGVLATGDRFGVRTVIGDNALRRRLASEACQTMLGRGAKAVLVSFKWMGKLALPRYVEEGRRTWAMQTRTVRDTLPLASTAEETLARMGKRTRTHLRYYRRRAEKAVGCAYVPDAAGLLNLHDAAMLRGLNEGSLDPIAQAEFALQLRTAATLPGGFIAGVRSGDGRWLALVGGWRQAGTTWVQWQTNASGYEELSLGTALRACLIEDEVARGTTRLAFHGGTSHSMSHAFEEEQVVDIVATRGGSAAWRLMRLAPWLYRRFPSLASRGNLLGDVVSSEQLRWFREDEFAGVFGAASDGLQTPNANRLD